MSHVIGVDIGTGSTIGAVPPDTDWTRPDHVVVPDPATRSTYSSLLQTFTELYPATREQVHRLARTSL